VADGRDMGTVVFPDARLKVFLTASAAQRAERRHKQLISKGIPANIEDLRADVPNPDRLHGRRILCRPVRGKPQAQRHARGEVITAEVVRIDHNFVVVNAGLKSESLHPHRRIQERPGRTRSPGRRLRLGGHRRLENGYGDTILSRDKAKRLAAWMSLEKRWTTATSSPAPSPARSRAA
jgi:hypothetical protein